MSARDASIALRRFGLGARPGDMSRIASDPRGYVLGSLDARAPMLTGASALASSAQSSRAVQALQREVRAARADTKSPEPVEAGKSKVQEPTVNDEGRTPGRVAREAFLDEATARLRVALSTDAPMVERLVMFWSNHFCVSAAKGPVMRAIAGAFEREAIRPHVLGRFGDMLRAVEQHPAMLIYLDNQLSLGPESRAGLRRKRGLNENLAREILELHTLGVDGGYTQSDVTNLARIITGWTVGRIEAPEERAGRFVFAENFHEPGRWQVLGKTYGGSGIADGEAVLADLARHPSTAGHIARKLAQHFVGDAPPAGLIDALKKRFVETDGDLAALARTLVNAPESWAAEPAKILPPWDFVVAAGRGLEVEVKTAEALRLSAALGQPLWQVTSPKGWPDTDNAWTAPSAIRERLRIAERAAREVPATRDPRAILADLLGDAASEHTRRAVARADSREQGLALLVMAPEFQRR